MDFFNTRVITQFLVGLMLSFGGFTLIPKAIMLFRAKNPGKAILYIVLGCISFFFALLAFLMAFDKI